MKNHKKDSSNFLIGLLDPSDRIEVEKLIKKAGMPPLDVGMTSPACQEIHALFGDYLRNRLGEDEIRKVEDHRMMFPACDEEYFSYVECSLKKKGLKKRNVFDITMSNVKSFSLPVGKLRIKQTEKSRKTVSTRKVGDAVSEEKKNEIPSLKGAQYYTAATKKKDR
jgi:hypothetical protein